MRLELITKKKVREIITDYDKSGDKGKAIRRLNIARINFKKQYPKKDLSYLISHARQLL